jgi:carboxyl-terminal processing protease
LDAKLERVFVITSRSSASASEAVINGLRPFMEVITIGDDTHGKPVGMNAREIGAYTLVAIMFKVANANGEADYFEGIRANAKISDNLAADFGDVADNCLQEALHYIQTGRFSGVTARRSFAPADNIIELPGFRAEIGAF